jgi:hypothetical protein
MFIVTSNFYYLEIIEDCFLGCNYFENFKDWKNVIM